jgi:hypothetical protein
MSMCWWGIVSIRKPHERCSPLFPISRQTIDVMKSVQPLHREGLRYTQTVHGEGLSYKVPSLEMALALKFGPMVSPNRADGKKRRDASDFTLFVAGHPEIDLEKLAELGDLVFPGGGVEILELVRKIRAGEKLLI